MDKWRPNFIDRQEIQKRNEDNGDATDRAVEEGDTEKMEFAIAKETIESTLGIKLTNIELVGLRKIVKEVLEEAKKINPSLNKHSRSLVWPMSEIPIRFYYVFYGITDKLTNIFPPQKDKMGSEIWPTPIMHEFFQREQAKLHNEI